MPLRNHQFGGEQLAMIYGLLSTFHASNADRRSRSLWPEQVAPVFLMGEFCSPQKKQDVLHLHGSEKHSEIIEKPYSFCFFSCSFSTSLDSWSKFWVGIIRRIHNMSNKIPGYPGIPRTENQRLGIKHPHSWTEMPSFFWGSMLGFRSVGV